MQQIYPSFDYRNAVQPSVNATTHDANVYTSWLRYTSVITLVCPARLKGWLLCMQRPCQRLAIAASAAVVFEVGVGRDGGRARRARCAGSAAGVDVSGVAVCRVGGIGGGHAGLCVGSGGAAMGLLFGNAVCVGAVDTVVAVGARGGIEVDAEGEDIKGENKGDDPLDNGTAGGVVGEGEGDEGDGEDDLDEDEGELDPEGDAEDAEMAVFWMSGVSG